MSVLLAVTVGGSCQPVVASIQDYRPDFVVFIVSTGAKGSRKMVDGEGAPCAVISPDGQRQSLPNILTQTELPPENCAFISLNSPDALSQCFDDIRTGLAEHALQRSDSRRIADYTGGTKTMSAALVLFALEAGWELSLVKGARTDLVRVMDGSEMASLAGGQEVRCRQRMAEARALFNGFSFSPAAELFESLMRQFPLNPGLSSQVRDAACMARAFDAWDRFDYARARQLLQPFQSQAVPQWIFLKSLLGKTRSTGYEMVFDLIGNADRRAECGRYDDAAARLYRALELLAQTRLAQRNPPINSADVDRQLVPESLRQQLEKLADQNGCIKMGLYLDYELLLALNDPLGAAFEPFQSRILTALLVRNQSILAHGISPITAAEYLEMKNIFEELVAGGFSRLKICNTFVQFPQLIEEGLIQRN